MVFYDLWQRQDGFDGETDVTNQGDVEWCSGNERQENMDEQQNARHVGQELEVWFCSAPSPEVEWPFARHEVFQDVVC